MKGTDIGSEDNIMKLIHKQSSRYFIIIGYFINANNIMYENTCNIEYLKRNDRVLKEFKSKKGGFLAKFYEHEQNFELNGKESNLLDGYLYRYLAQYYYLLNHINSDKLIQHDIDNDFAYVEDRFLYWLSASIKAKGDSSFLYGIRVHMGSNWAITGLYLNEISTNYKHVYNDFLTDFDTQLRNNMNVVTLNGYKVFQWHSTYDNAFSNQLKERRKMKLDMPRIQDVSHANHVVQYILTAYELNYNIWSENDIKYLVNTLKHVIYLKYDDAFADFIDGSITSIEEYQNTGIKQSDGWMKLIKYDDQLIKIYESLYTNKNEWLQKTNYYNQFIANLTLEN